MSLIHQPGFEHVQALVIGRFQKESQMTPALLEKIIRDKRELQHMPVIADVDFGHTTPMFTFPIGAGLPSMHGTIRSAWSYRNE